MSAVQPWTGGRVCIVMMSAIGDAVRVLPVIAALKRHAPATHVTWILQPAPAELMRDHPAVDTIEIFDKARGWRAYGELRHRLREPFDLVIDLQVAFKAGMITALLRSPVKLGFDRARARDLNWLFTSHRIPARPVQHVQDQYFEFLTTLGVPVDPVVWDLGPWPHEREAQRALVAGTNGPLATLAIGTSHRQKEWLPERWAELNDALVERYGLHPMIASGGSPRERATTAEILARSRHPPRVVGGLRTLVSLLDASALVIAPDTAPLHMAVALGRPVIGLMGYANPKRVGPYRVFQDLVVDAFGDPGEEYAVSAPNRHHRMQRIRTADVLEKVDRWQERYAASAPRPGA